MPNWAMNRSVLLQIAAGIVERWNSSAQSVAETMARCHYQGKSRRHAEALFRRDLEELVARRRSEKAEQRWKQLKEMADKLVEEGWKFLTTSRGAGFWWHESGVSVNRQGGGFQTYEEATETAFNSAVRDWVCC